MRSTTLLTALSTGALSSASALPRDTECYGELFDGLCCVSGQWSGDVFQSAESSFVASYYAANSASVQSDISAAQPAVSTVTSIVAAGESRVASFLYKRSDITTNFAAAATGVSSFINSEIDNLRSELSIIEASWTAPPFVPTSWPTSPVPTSFITLTVPHVVVNNYETVTVQTSILNDVSSELASSSAISRDEAEIRASLSSVMATFVPPTIATALAPWVSAASAKLASTAQAVKSEVASLAPSTSRTEDEIKSSLSNVMATFAPPTFPTAAAPWQTTAAPNKRAVLVVSPGLTCLGQAVVIMSAPNAAALVTSATRAAAGTIYINNGNGGDLAL